MAESEPAWTIIGQVEDYRQNDAGAFVQGVVVTFRTAEGVQLSVFVPNDKYSVDEVRRAIVERAKAARTISSLQG